jgi:predicted metal-dependent phosphoesterase TrpH
MPRRSPFTALCQGLAEALRPVAADLHAHTTASDGEFTPSGLVALARRAGLAAVAVTDHDTLAGHAEAAATGAGLGVTVVPGVECTAEVGGREFHVLGLFVDPTHAEFVAQLADVGRRRRARFLGLIKALAGQGVTFTPGRAEAIADSVPSLGRRHVASLLVASGVAATWGEAFGVHLKAVLPAVPPAHFTPLAEVTRRIHAAGGLAVLAHPPFDLDGPALHDLAGHGLDGWEAGHPSQSPARAAELRALAAARGLVTTAGSDFHGPANGRAVGTHGLSRAAWDALSTGRPARA